jgi:lipopolysaccharide cholinephosphotransferase
MITPELQEQFRAEYNPDGSVLRRQQMRMLDILLHVDRVCKEHNIPYWLSSGTLLGAVRHGGFIPWDDDLDIEMMREDFLRFKSVFKDTENYIIQTHENDLHYIMPYVKVRDTQTVIEEYSGGANFKYKGVFIDIFALEYTHKFVNHQTHMRLRRIRKFDNKHKPSRFVEWLIALRKRMAFSSFKVWRAISNLFPGQQLRHTYGTWCYRKPRFEEDLFPLTTIKFEGYDFPAPHNSDAYLRKIYGDYMQLPEVKEVHTKTIEFLE